MFFIFLRLNAKRLFIDFLVNYRNFDNKSQQPANYDATRTVSRGTVCQRACEYPIGDFCYHFNLVSRELCDVSLVFGIRPGFADCGASSNFRIHGVFQKTDFHECFSTLQRQSVMEPWTGACSRYLSTPSTLQQLWRLLTTRTRALPTWEWKRRTTSKPWDSKIPCNCDVWS